MAPSAAAQRPYVEVIDLVSDDSDVETPATTQGLPEVPQVLADDAEDEEAYHTPPLGGSTPVSDFLGERFHAAPAQNNGAQGGIFVNVDGEEIFIPDEYPENPIEVAATAAADPTADRDHEIALALNERRDRNHEIADTAAMEPEPDVARDHEMALALDTEAVTADDCLQKVLDIFPDISHEYVINLYNDFGAEDDYETLPGQARLDNIIEQLVSATSYPKQEKGKQALKRKRQDSVNEDEIRKWESEDRIPVPTHLKGSMQAMLKAEFPEIPVRYINETLGAQKYLYQTFVALAKARDTDDASNRVYGKGRASTRHLANADTIATNCGWPELGEELHAARLRVQIIRAERAADDAKKKAEEENLQRATAAGETAECSACFDDLPMNRQIHCNGPVAHFTCFDCAETYIKSEVGESRCRVLCTAGCGAGFATHQLDLLADKQLLEKLSQLQQEKDIRDAGLDDLEECPFCDYKAILPPIEEDFEFRCGNPTCEKVSCRRCKCVSHVPVSCEQHAKDNKVNSRHKIEEAMTAALIRSCNKCKKQFIKEYGCNKMTCPSCGNLQCYVCSTSLKDYNHFDQGPARPAGGANGARSKLCPLYDNVEERHEREVQEAEAAARAQVVSENPDVTPEDLDIKVSDAVKKATADRIRQAGGGVAGLIPPVPFGGARNMFQGLFGGDDDAEDMARALQANRFAAQAQIDRMRNAIRNGQPEAGGARHHRLGLQFPPAPAPPPAVAGGYGLPAGLQAFIPVFGIPPERRAPARNRAAAQVPQGHGAYNPGPAPDFHNYFDDFGMNFPFGGDAAADVNQPTHADPAPANNNLFHGLPHRQRQHHVPAMPGAFPPTAPRPAGIVQGADENMPDPRQQRQNFQQLELMRQQHDLQMLEREQQREQHNQRDRVDQLRQRMEQRLAQGEQRQQQRDLQLQQLHAQQQERQQYLLNQQMAMHRRNRH